MSLEKNLKETDSKNNSSETLNTQEILSLLSKTSQDFKKDTEVTTKVSNLFKKKTLGELARISNLKKEDKNTKLKQEETNTNIENNKEKEGNKEDKEQVKEEAVEEKKYSEVEAKKLANDLAKEYYEKGYRLGEQKTKEQLEKGDKALAVKLKNVTDNIFRITPELSKKINETINQNFLKISREVLGYEIDTKTDYFLKKINELSRSIEDSTNKTVFFLNDDDHKAIINYLEKNKIGINFSLEVDSNLQRGDLKIKSGSIEIGEFLDEKIKFSNSTDINSDISNIENTFSNPAQKTNLETPRTESNLSPSKINEKMSSPNSKVQK
tara:strand:- start:488 stop:1462 length:975 start_codon:yes stop_codon:yes gene_type:complete